MSWVTLHIAVCTCARAYPISVCQERLGRLRSNLLCICDPINCDPISLRGGRFALWAVCAVGGLRDGRFARFAWLAVCAVGGLRGWRFVRLAVCAVGGLSGGRFARWVVCYAVGGLRGWRFPRFALGGLRLAVSALQFAVGGLRLTIGGLRFALDVVVLQLEFCGSP